MAEERAEIDHSVARGADPNARDTGGCTPLHYAAWDNPVGEVAGALFEADANPAGNGEVFMDAQAKVQLSCPDFGKMNRPGFPGGSIL